MKNHAVVLACSIVTAALTVTSCGKEIGGQPTPAIATSASDPNSGHMFSKAPTVAQPLDVGKYLASPCGSLTALQYQNFDTRPGVPGDDKMNPNCAWTTNDGETRISISYMLEVTQGLSGVYAQNDIGFWKDGYFEPATVDGYPAVYASILDSRAKGKCQLNVGVNDNLYFISSVQSRADNDSCTAAINVAKAVIETVKKGA